MGSPFAATTPEPRKPTHQEVDVESTPRLSCKVCQDPVVRSVLGSNDWVHEDDEMTIPIEGAVVITKYDHPAQPDYLEATSRDVTA